MYRGTNVFVILIPWTANKKTSKFLDRIKPKSKGHSNNLYIYIALLYGSCVLYEDKGRKPN